MKEIAKATVKSVEEAFKFPRDRWDGETEDLGDDAMVSFFLDETNDPPLYHAFVDPGDPPVMFGAVSELPEAWLVED